MEEGTVVKHGRGCGSYSRDWGRKTRHLFTIFKRIGSDFYSDQRAVSSSFCSKHAAVTDEIFKRQQERKRDGGGREGRRRGSRKVGKKETRETQPDSIRGLDIKGKHELWIVGALEIGTSDWDLSP